MKHTLRSEPSHCAGQWAGKNHLSGDSPKQPFLFFLKRNSGVPTLQPSESSTGCTEECRNSKNTL